MSGIGHNNGPSLEPGFAFRKTAWSKARAELLPSLPIEVLRRRVKRAKELGLPYKTYASVRASTGRDVIGFLFSNNALRVLRAGDTIPDSRASKLANLNEAELLALVHRPTTPEDFQAAAAAHQLTFKTGVAPHFSSGWSATREAVKAPLRGLPRDGVLVIGDTVHEAEWSEAGKLAGFLPSERYFEGATLGR